MGVVMATQMAQDPWLDRRDVGTELGAVDVDGVDAGVGALARLWEIRAGRRDGQHPAASSDQPTVEVEGSAGVDDLDTVDCFRLVDADDQIALAGRAGIAVGGDDNGEDRKSVV